MGSGLGEAVQAAGSPTREGAGRAWVVWAGGFWGLVVFMPVGMNYLALLLLLLAVLLQGGYRSRLDRLKGHPVAWPLVFFVLWTLFIFSTQSFMFAETPSNLFHSLRIALTLALAVSLSAVESRLAVKCILVAWLLGLIYMGGHALGLFPDFQHLQHLYLVTGNNTIGVSISLGMLAAAGVVYALEHRGAARWLASLLVLSSLMVILFVLTRRGSALGFFIALFIVSIHRWRNQPGRLMLALAASLVFVGMAFSVPQVRQGFDRGVSEASRALDGEVSHASWNVRIQMVKHTSDMILDRPWTGWGIGGWNQQWRVRVPPMLADYNMPHNDLLWMGAQAGVVGALSWLSLMLAACWTGWRRRNWQAQAALAVAVVALFSALVNSATRDAVIGLPMLWILGVFLSQAENVENP